MNGAFFSKLDVTLMDFSKILAYEIIFNDVDKTDQDNVAKEEAKKSQIPNTKLSMLHHFSNTWMENGKIY